MTPLSRRTLRDDLLTRCFAGAGQEAHRSQRIGVEVELIPLDSLTGRRCPLEHEATVSTLPFVRRYGSGQGWCEGSTAKGTPCFQLPGGGAITFEPGGQLEYSSPPFRSAAQLLHNLRAVVVPLCSAASGEGIHLLASGIDPLNSIDEAPLLLRAKRYDRMARYFATRGPAGAQMMRQTASMQVNVDFPRESWRGWRVLNAASPYITAIFANSPIYRCRPTGYQSVRAAVWRAVDPARTGLPYDVRDPVDSYLDFALGAPAILLSTGRDEYPSFGDWMSHGGASLEEWQDHLTTLFPEVRPREHLELRSIDSLPAEWYAAPFALITGILYDAGSLHSADDLLGEPDPSMLDQAAQNGLHDSSLARTARDLFEIGLRGCRALGSTYFDPADLEQASTFFDRFPRRGRSPADDVLESAIAA
jgi:glutamate--cysteine ligase